MGCCDALLKAILVITNVVVMVAGAALVVVGAIFLAGNFDFFPDLEEYSNNVDAVLIAMIVIGVVLLIVGMVGCCGACTGKSGLLNFYFVVVFIVLILELVIIIVGVVKKDEVMEASDEAATTLFEGYTSRFISAVKNPTAISDAEALAVNWAQFSFSCCGLTNGPSYWKTDGNTEIPPGCCSDWTGTFNLDGDALKTSCSTDATTYSIGCTEAFNNFVEDFGIVLIVVIVLIMVFEIICLIAACVSKKKELVA